MSLWWLLLIPLGLVAGFGVGGIIWYVVQRRALDAQIAAWEAEQERRREEM